MCQLYRPSVCAIDTQTLEIVGEKIVSVTKTKGFQKAIGDVVQQVADTAKQTQFGSGKTYNLGKLLH